MQDIAQVSTDQLRRRMPEILIRTGGGEAIEVTHYRRPVFVLVPLATWQKRQEVVDGEGPGLDK